MSERLAQEEGGDIEIIRTAALLHDVEGSAPGRKTARANHHLSSAEFARQVLGKKAGLKDG